MEKSLPREHTVSFFKIIPLQNEILMPKGCFLMLNMRLYGLNDYILKHTVSYEEKNDCPITTTIDRAVRRQTGNCARRNAKSSELGLARNGFSSPHESELPAKLQSQWQVLYKT